MYTLKELQDPNSIVNSCQVELNGKWVPCRGENYKYKSFKQRIKEAYDVFSGKADAFTWPEGQ